jgi:hypothetical protein
VLHNPDNSPAYDKRFGLRVTAAKPEYILAMKLKALERVTADDRDYRDAVGLALECEVNTTDELKKMLQRFFGSDELPAFAEGRLASLVAAVREKRQS